MFSFLKLSTSKQSDDDDNNTILQRDKIFSALFYGISSLLVIFINKIIMTEFNFPYFNFLATIQFIVTTLILSVLILLKKIDMPMISYQICYEIIPISIMFLGNVICGLGSTKSLNLPMLTVLRRFSILMTMIAEWCYLNNKPSNSIIFSVFLMIIGATFAAIYDFTYSLNGYTLVLLNNIFTTLNGVWMKKASMSGKVSKIGILYYNSLFSSLVMIVFFLIDDIMYYNNNNKSFINQYLVFNENILSHNLRQSNNNSTMSFINQSINQISNQPSNSQEKPVHSMLYNISLYNNWYNINFISLFIIASFFGSILNYATFLCTSNNSALTTSVIGCLKNVLTTYIGMILFSDYSFNWINFISVNISVMGSLYYTYITMFKGIKGYGGS